MSTTATDQNGRIPSMHKAKAGVSERFAASRTRRAIEREQSRQVFDDGSTIYRDNPPGRGWVLEMAHEPKRYFEHLTNATARRERSIREQNR